jgi:hypothetical protein
MLAAGILLGSTGCLIWPFPTGDLLSGRGRILPEYASPLELGQATREDVLLRLGEPDEVLAGGSVFIYQWTEASGIVVLGGYTSAATIPIPGHRDLWLEFDAQGRLIRKTFGKQEREESPTAIAPQPGA